MLALVIYELFESCLDIVISCSRVRMNRLVYITHRSIMLMR